MDKLSHYNTGFAIFLLASIIGYPNAFLLVVIAAIGKEAYDHFHPGHVVELLDIVTTILGGIIGLLLVK